MFKSLDRDFQIIVKIVLFVAGIYLLWLIKDVIVILLLSLILASAMEPLVDYFNLKKVPRAVTVLAVYLIVIGFFGIVLTLILPTLIQQTKFVVEGLPLYLTEFREKYPVLSGFVGGLDPQVFVSQIFSSSDTGVFDRTVVVFNGFFTFVSVLVISFYLVAEEQGMKTFVTTLVPESKQEFTLNLLSKIQKKMGRWVLGQVILAAVIFAVTWAALSILGVKYALLLALIAGLFEVLPYLGPVLSAVPAIFFAFLQGPGLALIVAVLYLLIQKTESYIIVPIVMKRTIGLSPLVVLLALIVGLKLGGVIGLLLAVPLVAIFMVIKEEWSGLPK